MSKWLNNFALNFLNFFNCVCLFTGKELYSESFAVFNVHCCLHLTEEAVRYGGLDQTSGFPFENYLGMV